MPPGIGHGMAVELWPVPMRRGVVWSVQAVEAGRRVSGRVKPRRSWPGLFGRGEVWRDKAVEAGRVWLRQAELRRGRARRSRLVKLWRDRVWPVKAVAA